MGIVDRLLVLAVLRMASNGRTRSQVDYPTYIKGVERQRAAWARRVNAIDARTSRDEARARRRGMEVPPTPTVIDPGVTLARLIKEGRLPS